MNDNNNDEHSLIDQVPQDFVNPADLKSATTNIAKELSAAVDDVPLGVESDVQHLDLESKR